MAQWHLDDLRKKLNYHGILVVNETLGNEYDISALWELSLKSGSTNLYIEFEGLGDDHVLPIEKSYGVRIKRQKHISIHIPKGKPIKAGAKKQWSESVEYLINSIITQFSEISRIQ